MRITYALDPLVRRLLPSHNEDSVDRAQGWGEWIEAGGCAPVLKFIRWANGTPADDDEILQETLIVAYTKVENGQYEHRDLPFSAFLKKIAWFKIMEASRQQRRHVSIDELPDDHFASEEGGPNTADLWKEHEALQHALNRLPHRRSKIVMLYEHGYTTAEIAEHFGIQEALVRKEKSLGLRQLRETIRIEQAS